MAFANPIRPSAARRSSGRFRQAPGDSRISIQAGGHKRGVWIRQAVNDIEVMSAAFRRPWARPRFRQEPGLPEKGRSFSSAPTQTWASTSERKLRPTGLSAATSSGSSRKLSFIAVSEMGSRSESGEIGTTRLTAAESATLAHPIRALTRPPWTTCNHHRTRGQGPRLPRERVASPLSSRGCALQARACRKRDCACPSAHQRAGGEMRPRFRSNFSQ